MLRTVRINETMLRSAGQAASFHLENRAGQGTANPQVKIFDSNHTVIAGTNFDYDTLCSVCSVESTFFRVLAMWWTNFIDT